MGLDSIPVVGAATDLVRGVAGGAGGEQLFEAVLGQMVGAGVMTMMPLLSNTVSEILSEAMSEE